MRILSAAAVNLVIVILTICIVSVIAIPETPSDACEHSLGEKVRSDIYEWKGPGGYTVTEIQISEDDFKNSFKRNTVRHSSFFIKSPVSFIEPDDKYVRQIASEIKDIGNNDEERASMALSFVQSLDYHRDEQLYGQVEFWAYPVETLYLHGGDCEDLAVLLCSILLAMDIECILLDYEGHISVGAYVGGQGAYYTLDGKRYYVYEPTGVCTVGIDFHKDEPVIRMPSDDPAAQSLIQGAVAFTRNAVQHILGI